MNASTERRLAGSALPCPFPLFLLSTRPDERLHHRRPQESHRHPQVNPGQQCDDAPKPSIRIGMLERDLHNNKLIGPIPPQIGQLKCLKTLYLSFNSFKGEIPAELGNLPELRYLYLQENHLTGRIARGLCNLPNLRHLDIGNNHLVGTLRELALNEGCFPALRNFYLNNN